MANLTYTEQETIEIFLVMKNGYVMDFSNRTFQEFIIKSVGRNIYDEKYNYDSNSKANRLRRFIEVESNYTVGTLLSAFCEYWRLKVNTREIDQKNDENLYNECLKIAERLKKENIVEDIDANILNVDDKNIELLKQSLKNKNQIPEDIISQILTLINEYKGIEEDIYNELLGVLDLIKVGQEIKAIKDLTKIIENLLKDKYKNEEKFKGQKFVPFAKLIEYAKELEFFNLKEYNIACILRDFRNEESHQLNVTDTRNMINIALVGGIELISRITRKK
jgi:hypothetical protein